LELNPGVEIEDEHSVILGGEWVGPGVLNSLPQRSLVLLTISIKNKWQRDEDYADIENESVGIYNISQGGFSNEVLNTEVPQPCKEKLLAHTLDVESKCPFARSFGASGIGEGIVWKAEYPLSENARFWLKPKGPEHRVTQTDKLKMAEMKEDGAERAKMFAEAAATEMRLEQAWDYPRKMGINRDKSGTPAVNQWLYKDVTVKENKAIGEMGIDKGMLKKRLGLLGRLGTSSDCVKYELFLAREDISRTSEAFW
jgi:hypothetical protein